jgi:hypothetical protein
MNTNTPFKYLLLTMISPRLIKFCPDTPCWFLPTIIKILHSRVPTPSHPPLMFELSDHAASHNKLLLMQHGNSIQNLITAYPGSFISPGSEFRPVDTLETLLMHHHNWPKIKSILTTDSVWPLHPISSEDQREKNKEFMQQGNHKSAVKYADEYTKTIRAEIDQGWMFVLPLAYINSLHHGESAPVGVDDKVWSDLPDGSRKTKYRLTHDQSFEASLGSSVNSRVIREKLNPLFHGGCLSRIIHYIVDLRLRHPCTPILGGKSDFKAAYRRIGLHGNIAEK